MAAVGAPVPAVLWAGDHDGSPTIVQQWIEGVPALRLFRRARGDERLALVEMAAAAHARLCRAALEAPFLDLAFMTHVQGVPSGRRDWPRLLAAQVGKWLSRVKPETLEALGGTTAADALARRVQAAPEDLLAVVHCDYLFRNLIVAPEGAGVIIDFGAALAGDPRYDLAKIAWRDLDGHGGDLATRFVQGWRERTGIEVPDALLSLYTACHALAALAWVDKRSAPLERDAGFRKLALEAWRTAAKPWL
jgi:aminoglycoside phosphotransferase (APT) family kinase protein